MPHPARVIAQNFVFLEAPRWHANRIWFSDFYTHGVFSAQHDGSDLRQEAAVPGQPSGAGWLPDGRLLVVSMRDRKLLRREVDGSLQVHADLSAYLGGHANDMVVDAQGRAWVGEFGFDLMAGVDFAPANLLRVDPDGSIHVAARDLYFPNGCAITADQVLLVCETFGNCVTAFDIAADGSLRNRRTWASLGPRQQPGPRARMMGSAAWAPDGCCLDADGTLWVADALGNRAVRIREGGEILEEIQPGTGVFACMLGGPQGRTLYLCTAPDSSERRRVHAREARLLAVDVSVPRAGRP